MRHPSRRTAQPGAATNSTLCPAPRPTVRGRPYRGGTYAHRGGYGRTAAGRTRSSPPALPCRHRRSTARARPPRGSGP